MVRTLLLLTVRGRRAFERRRAVVALTGTAFPAANGKPAFTPGDAYEGIGVYDDTGRLGRAG